MVDMEPLGPWGTVSRAFALIALAQMTAEAFGHLPDNSFDPSDWFAGTETYPQVGSPVGAPETSVGS